MVLVDVGIREHVVIPDGDDLSCSEGLLHQHRFIDRIGGDDMVSTGSVDASGRKFESLHQPVRPVNDRTRWIGDHHVELVDDYAHHPTELEATLQAGQACWPDRRQVIVFQPHRYSRTRDLFDEFAQLLAGVENLIVTEVYAAGEQPISGSDGKSLCRAIRKRGNDPIFVESLEELEQQLPKYLVDGDVLFTLGAGDIGRFARDLASQKGTASEVQNDG